jgi:hypothetical protein
MHVKVQVRKAQAWAKVRKAVWAWKRAHAVSSWDGSDFEWVRQHVVWVWEARRAARSVR